MHLLQSRASAFLVAAVALQLPATTTATLATATATPPRVTDGPRAQHSALPPPPLRPEEHRARRLPPPRRPHRAGPLRERRRTAADGAAPPAWYPDWVSGTNVCLRDRPLRPAPHYMLQQKLLMDSMEACCDSYYWWDAAVCLEASDEGGGAVAFGAAVEGSREWYADYGGFRCAQDCPAGTEELRCGGLLVAPTAATTTAAATAATTSTPSTATSTTTVLSNSSAAPGTSAPGTSAPPPLRHLAVAVTATSATATACCQSQFPYLALGLCVASSESDDGYAGNGEYYVDYGNGRCVQDCRAPTEAPAAADAAAGICGGIVTESFTRLYADPATCCSTQLSYLDPLLCATRSEAGGGGEGTFRLYPSFNTGTCVIDHNPDAIICSIGYTCRLLRPTAWVSKLYPVTPAGVETCCAEGLAFVNPSYCKARTMGVASNKWFVNYAKKRCFQDCEASGGASCALNRDPTVTYYDAPAACCSDKLGYLNQPGCLADSTGVAYEGTGKFYVAYAQSKCVQDCPAAPAVVAGANSTLSTNCGGVVQDSSTQLHPDSLWCCAKDLGYMNLDLCVDRSNGTSVGTGLYYPSGDGDSFCVKDTSATPCPPGETCRRVDGWISTVYDTIAECCQSEDPALPARVSPVYCQALSTGADGTEKWFKNEGDAWCAKHCSNATNAACAIPLAPPSFYYDTAQACCSAQLSYLNAVTCAELSHKGGVLSALVGTDEYYVDWIQQRCVRNCPAGNLNAECGGIAGGNWVDLHPDVAACCRVLHYVDQDECVTASTSG